MRRVVPGQIAPSLAALPARYRSVVAGADPAALTRRPGPDTWTPVEYLCHMRDVLLVQRDRAVLALVEDKPSFARMYRDERAGLCRYGAEGAATVLAHLDVAADLCATVFAGVEGAAWGRPLVYNYPAPIDTDLIWLGRHTLHEGEHHLFDVTRLLTLP